MATGNTERNHHFQPIDGLPNIYLTPELLAQTHNIIMKLRRHPMILTPNDMRFELLRLFAFMIHFPRNRGIDLHALAIAGFYPTGVRDYAACYCCGLFRGNWTREDIPIEIHKRHSPNCDFILRNGRVNTPFILITEGGLRRTLETTDMIEAAPTGPSLVRPADEVQQTIIRVINRTHDNTHDQIEFLDVLPGPNFTGNGEGGVNILEIEIRAADLNIALRENDRAYSCSIVNRISEIALLSSSDSRTNSFDGSFVRIYHSQSMSDSTHGDRDRNDSDETELKAVHWRGPETETTYPVEVSDHENFYVNADPVIETSRLPGIGNFYVTSLTPLYTPGDRDDSISQNSNEAIGEQATNKSNLSENTNEKENSSLSVTEIQLETESETTASYATDVTVSDIDETLRKHSTDLIEPGVINDNANDFCGKQQEKDNIISQGALSKGQKDKKEDKPQSIPSTNSLKTLGFSPVGRSTSKEDAKEGSTEDYSMSYLENEESSTDSDHAVDQSLNDASAFGDSTQIDKNEEFCPSTSKMQSKKTSTLSWSSDIRSASEQDANIGEVSSDHCDTNKLGGEEPSTNSDRAIGQSLNDATASDGQIENNEDIPSSAPMMQSKKTPVCSADNRSISIDSNHSGTDNLKGEKPHTSSYHAIGQSLNDAPDSKGMQSKQTLVCTSDIQPMSRGDANITEDATEHSDTKNVEEYSTENSDTNKLESEEPPLGSDHVIVQLLNGTTDTEDLRHCKADKNLTLSTSTIQTKEKIDSRQIDKKEESFQSTPTIRSKQTLGLNSEIRPTSKPDTNIQEHSSEQCNINSLEGEDTSAGSDHVISAVLNDSTATKVPRPIDKNEELFSSTQGTQSHTAPGNECDIGSTSTEDANIKEVSTEDGNMNIHEREESPTRSNHAVGQPLNNATGTKDKIIPVYGHHTETTESTLSKGTNDNLVGVHNSVTSVTQERNSPTSIGQTQRSDSCSIIRVSEMHPKMKPARRRHASTGSTIYEEPEKDFSAEQSIPRAGTGNSYRSFSCNTNRPVTRQSSKTDNKLNGDAFNVILRQTGNLRDDPTCNIHLPRRRRTCSESSYFEDDETTLHDLIPRPTLTHKEDINPKEIFKDGTLQQQASVEYAVSTTGEHREKHQASLREKEACSNSQDKENEELSNLITEKLKMIGDPGTKQRLLHKFLEDIEQAKMGDIPEQ